MAPPHPFDGLLRVSPGPLFALPKLGNTLGAVLLGSIFGFMLYGLMLHQTYRYYRMYPADGLVLKGLVIVMFLSLAWDFVATVKVFHAPTLQAFSRYSWIVSVAYGLAVLCDLITASALILALLRSRTGVRRTDSVVEVLVLYTVNTGLLTTIVGLLVFVFALAQPDNLIYAGLSIPGVKLYSNSVLAMLNSRKSLSARMNDGVEDCAYGPGPVRPLSHQTAGVGVLETWAVREMPVSLAVTGSTTRSYVEEEARESQPSLGDDGLAEKRQCVAIEGAGNDTRGA
ncbi:hypothetical protein C8Q78DRAFT_1082604 [Trametes maxima]|nr:hypothetical protein C8Q78DRAFT_1082604 [Trametes maxima]